MNTHIWWMGTTTFLFSERWIVAPHIFQFSFSRRVCQDSRREGLLRFNKRLFMPIHDISFDNFLLEFGGGCSIGLTRDIPGVICTYKWLGIKFSLVESFQIPWNFVCSFTTDSFKRNACLDTFVYWWSI